MRIAQVKHFGGQAKMFTEITPTIRRMQVSGRTKFKGNVQAVILDWSGTTADAHVLAPAVVFKEVFEKHEVPISMAEARIPMGLRKDLHIKQILEMPDVQARWKKIKGRDVDLGKDTAALFKDFVPMQLKVLDKYSSLLPGTAETVSGIQESGIKVGSTTGFTKSMVDVLLDAAKKQGYTPDFSCAGDEVEADMGFRPAPFMVYRNLCNLGVWPIESVIKVDDTIGGVGEGLNAGCWAVGIANWSNYTDVDSLEQWDAMSEAEQKERQKVSRDKLLYESGAHYVMDNITDLPTVIKDVNRRLAEGEKP